MRCAFGTGRAQRQSAKSCRIDDSKCWPGHARFSAVALFAPQTRSASVNREGSCSARFEKSFTTESTETTEQSSVARILPVFVRQTRTRAGCPWYKSLLRGHRALGVEPLRFTKLDVALRHLTLLDLFIDSPKRTHRGRACGQSPVGPTIGTRRRIAYWSRVRLAVWRPSFRWRGVRAHNKLLHARVLTV